MRILFTRFPLQSIENGGSESQTVLLMKGLLARGHAVAFAGSCPALLRMCRAEHIPAIEYHIGPPPVTKWGAISFVWRKHRMKAKLASLINEFSVHSTHYRLQTTNSSHLDAVVMLSLSEKLLLTDSAANNGMKVYWIEHDRVGNWLKKNPWLKLLLERSRQAVTIVVSKLSRTIYLGLGWRKNDVVVIANGITSSLSSGERARESSHTEFHIGCVSRLSHEKGVDLLLEAVSDLPDVSLTIVGRGPEERRIRSMVDRINRNTSDRLRLIPNVDNVDAFYRTIDALVLPSRDHDPFGLVAAEAMMLGIPVIVTDACGIAGYMENGKDALIVKANAVMELKKAIISIQDSGFRIQIGQAGQNTAKEKFAVKKMVEAYEALFTGDAPHHS